jgi:hypothetical protein
MKNILKIIIPTIVLTFSGLKSYSQYNQLKKDNKMSTFSIKEFNSTNNKISYLENEIIENHRNASSKYNNCIKNTKNFLNCTDTSMFYLTKSNNALKQYRKLIEKNSAYESNSLSINVLRFITSNEAKNLEENQNKSINCIKNLKKNPSNKAYQYFLNQMNKTNELAENSIQ